MCVVTVRNNKQLLDEDFVIPRIIKVEVRVFRRNRRLRLITLPGPWLFWVSQKPHPIIFIIHWTKKKWKSCFCFFSARKFVCAEFVCWLQYCNYVGEGGFHLCVESNFDLIDFIDFATVNHHCGRRWNRTYVPIDINSFITHPAHESLTTTPGTTHTLLFSINVWVL